MQSKESYLPSVNFKNYAYLMLIDPSLCYKRKKFLPDYEKEEQKYGINLLKAFNEVLVRGKFDGNLTPELIQSINRTAMAHNAPLNGLIRNETVNFAVYTQSYAYPQNCNANASTAGILQFVQEWFPKKIHTICNFFQNQSNIPLALKESFYLFPSLIDNTLNIVTCHGEIPGYGKSKVTKYEEKDQIKIKRVMEHTVDQINVKKLDAATSEKPIYICKINCAPDELIKKEDIEPSITKCLSDICQKYNDGIRIAKDGEEKLKLIAKTVQLLSQLHVFFDGNTRTCYALLLMLLKANSFPLTMLFNPNCFEGFSLDEVIHHIKCGQQTLLQLTNQNTIPSFKNHEILTKALNAGLEDVVLTPFDLTAYYKNNTLDIDIFINNVTEYNRIFLPQHLAVSSAANDISLTLFAKKSDLQTLIIYLHNMNNEHPNIIHESLFQAIADEKYDLALRKIASICDTKALELLLQYLEKINKLDECINSQSLSNKKTALQIANDYDENDPRFKNNAERKASAIKLLQHYSKITSKSLSI